MESRHVSKYHGKNEMPTSAAVVSDQCPVLLQFFFFYTASFMTSRNLFYTGPFHQDCDLEMRSHAYWLINSFGKLLRNIRLYFLLVQVLNLS